MLRISFSSGTFPKVHSSRRPLPLFHYSSTTKRNRYLNLKMDFSRNMDYKNRNVQNVLKRDMKHYKSQNNFKCAYIDLTMVVFKMRDSVPSARYPPVCNVLRLWRNSLIPTHRVYRLYDIFIGLSARTHARSEILWSIKDRRAL